MEAMLPLFIAGAVILMPVLYVIVQYNQLVGLRNHIRDAWSNIDTELKRRYDLIPNLVQTVKGYAKHEQQVLERVVELRNRCAGNRGRPGEQAADENRLVEGLKQLWAVAEAYPELRADQHFLRLQKELVITEDRIQAARRFYNGNVREYRNKCEQFPSSLVANAFHFEREEFFTVHPSVREVPDVDL